MQSSRSPGASLNVSIVDGPAGPVPDRPLLVVSIDTEEEGLWSGTYPETGEVTNIRGVPRFQRLCEGLNILPTYLIDGPVVESREAVDILKPLQDRGVAEIGAHIHPWNNPPKVEQRTRRDSFLCNLPEPLQREKLEWLTESISARFGRQPRSFRAGRYGIGVEGIRILRDLGYWVDSSVLPYTDYRDDEGPDFRAATPAPYFLSSRSILSRGSGDGLLEVPVTAGFTHRYFEPANRLRAIAMRNPFRCMRTVGMLDRLGIARKVKLSPEQANLDQMKKLARATVARGTRCLVLMFHSSSLKPGCSPYVKSGSDLDQFLYRLERFFAYCLSDLRCVPVTLSGCYGQRHFLTQASARTSHPS